MVINADADSVENMMLVPGVLLHTTSTTTTTATTTATTTSTNSI